MSSLYIKELMLRGDVRRALVLAPGRLVEQWQDEPHKKSTLTPYRESVPNLRQMAVRVIEPRISVGRYPRAS